MSFKELKKWESELNTCIRCGYCYENCHMFKILPWETNSPRGKMLLAYGLMTGDLEPSEKIGEKFFECFYCGLCETSCSANVSLRDIITNIKETFTEAGLKGIEGTTASVNEDVCSGCGLCTKTCKPEATTLEDREDGRKVAVVDRAKCTSCGVCIATCPSGARSLQEGYKVSRKELKSELGDRLTKQYNAESLPKTVVFSCNWSTSPGLRLSNILNDELDEGVKPIISMCSGRINPTLVLQALMDGAWGVLIAACPLGECDNHGNYRMQKRMELLRNTLSQFNINPERLKIEWVGANETGKLDKAVKDFNKEMTELGPVWADKETLASCFM